MAKTKEIKPTKPFWQLLVALTVLALTAIVLVAILRDRIVNYPQYQVNVIGRGEAQLSSDMATVVLAINTKDEKGAAEAYKAHTVKALAVMNKLQSLGVAKEDTAVTAYNLSPQYNYDKNNNPVIDGYLVFQQISVNVYGIDKNALMVSKVIEETTKVGVDQVSGITFSVKDLEKVKQEARLKAVADAKVKAKEMARATGVRLGEIVGWWENIVSTPEQPLFMDGKGGAGPVGPMSITPGQLKVVIEMNINYKLK
ncbi:MAG: SIMPL domain-containing protein [bacterium]